MHREKTLQFVLSGNGTTETLCVSSSAYNMSKRSSLSLSNGLSWILDDGRLRKISSICRKKPMSIRSITIQRNYQQGANGVKNTT